MNLKYKQWSVVFVCGQYCTGRLAIELVDAHDGERITVVTVNLEDVTIEDDEVIIKTWSENEGMVEWLQSVGVVTDIVRTEPTGYAEACVCKVDLDKLCEYDPGLSQFATWRRENGC
jgi:hypothetical protein